MESADIGHRTQDTNVGRPGGLLEVSREVPFEHKSGEETPDWADGEQRKDVRRFKQSLIHCPRVLY